MSSTDLDSQTQYLESVLKLKLIETELRGPSGIGSGNGRRVYHCIGSLGPGGAERQLCNTAISSARCGWHIRVLTTSDLSGIDGHYLPMLAEAGIKAHRAGSALHPSLKDSLTQQIHSFLDIPGLPPYLSPHVLDFAAEMLAEPPDIVHAWLDLTNIWAGIAAFLAGVPNIILSFRNMNPNRFPYLNQDWFKAWYILLASSPRVQLTSNSAAGAQDYASWLGFSLKRIRVIANGIDCDSIPKPAHDAVTAMRNNLAPNGGKILSGVFRLSAEKQPMLFFEVARRQLELLEDLTVVVVGDGPLRDDLEEAIMTHGLGARFRVLDPPQDVHALLAASDLLLMTSLYEGTPNIVLEAQKIGCPVVGTHSGGTSEAIEDGRTGYLLAVDDIDGLSSAVTDLLINPELRSRLGAAGPSFIAARFGLERMINQTLTLYGELAARSRLTTVPASRSPDGKGMKARLRAILGRAYRVAQRRPTGARVVESLRNSKVIVGDVSVPGAFREAIRNHAQTQFAFCNQSLQVVHCIGGLGPGGSERQLCNFVVAGATRGIDMRVLTIAEPVDINGYYVPQLKEVGIPVSQAAATRHPLLQQAVGSLPMLQRLDPCPPFLQRHMLDILGEIMVNPPQVLHCWLDLTNICGGVAGLLADVPAIILSTRSVNPTNFPGINNPWFKTWYQALADSPRVHFINNSTAGAQDYAQWLDLPACRFEVIRNGVDLGAHQRPTQEDRRALRHELGLGPDVPVLIGVFRMTEEKQPMLFFAAGLELIKRVPDAHVLLVGSGPFEEQIAKAIAAHDIRQRFHLLGQRRDVYQLMAASDLLLLTSRLEGTPNVLLEAQWMGCAVVTTPAGGAVDALDDGVTGLVVDDLVPEQLCEQVVGLMQDRSRLRAMGRAGPAFVAENFSVGRMVDETLALYQRALSPKTAEIAAAQAN